MDKKITIDLVLEQENKLYRAIQDGNVSMLDELLHKDLLFIIPSGEVITKEIDLKTYQDGMLKIDELTPKTENLHIIDDVAVITLTMKLKGKYDDVAFEATYRDIRF